jgi:cytochrome c peroxidase
MRLVRGLVLAAMGAAGAALAQDSLRQDALKLFGRVEAPAAATLATPEVELGRALFWDTRISLDGKTACASCHLDHGADRRKASIDAKGLPTSRHSPTVFNSLAQPKLRWLSDRKDGADQAEGSMTGSMGFASKQAAVEKLVELEYAAAFRKAYPAEAEPMNAKNYGRAIHAYEATLSTPAPFDRYLGGDDKALSERQMAGLRTFMSTGCTACHNGALLGGTLMQKFGLVRDYWLETGAAKPDVGLFAVTKKEEDRYVFRVPMLRNVAKTAPYFHDGSVETLEQAVKIMGAVQLGRTLDDASVASIVAFLESLTGDVPAHYAPPSGR